MQIRYWCWALFVVGLFGVAGQMDYEAAEADAAAYCENVESGRWPDFKNIYEKDCKTLDEGKQRI